MVRPDPILIANSRFGLGPRPGEDVVLSDPRGWLIAQIGAPVADLGRPDHMALQRQAHAARFGTDDQQAFRSFLKWARAERNAEAEARLAHAATTPAPFRERWVRFWSNHFTVSVAQPLTMHLVGAFEREAIRPHAFGRFGDMLMAATRHPAMLVYLDNANSVGPNSRKGRKRGRGSNENLARELLELHTLGVDGGYGQPDVEALAAMLTGWTVFGGLPFRRPDLDRAHGFTFRADLHEPGPKQFLGERVPESGEAEATGAIARLAAHPSTAHHISKKLSRHFVIDDPSDRLVEALAATFLDSGGDLKQLATELIQHDSAWRGPRDAKLRTPEQLVTAAARALDLTRWGRKRRTWSRRVVAAQAWLGQPPFGAPSPAGWSDRAEAWSGPEQILRRVELAARIGAVAGGAVKDPGAWASAVLRARLDDQLARAIDHAPSRAEAVSLALASPAFQWS